MKHIIKEHSKFTPTERRGIIGLVFLAFCLLCFIYTYDDLSHPHESVFENLSTANMSQNESVQRDDSIQVRSIEPSIPSSKNKGLILKTFDPNQISKAELSAMNFPKKGINTFLKYRATGKKFYSVDDFKSVYGFEELESSQLKKYMRFPKKIESIKYDTQTKKPSRRKDNRFTIKNDSSSATTHFKNKYPKREIIAEGSIDINTVDTSVLIKLKGIGEYRSQKLVEYRDAIGGFYHMEQIYEVPNVPDSIITMNLKYFSIDSSAISKVKVNDWTFEQLRRHPYIRYKRAKALSRYIREHGPIESQEELSKIIALDSAFVIKISPYLSYD